MNELQLEQLFTYQLMTEEGPDEEGISEMLYKIQLIELFKLDNVDDVDHVDYDKINCIIDSIFTELKDEPLIKSLFEIHPYKQYNMSDAIMFRTFFSFDYLYLFHKLLYYYSNRISVYDTSTCYLELKNKLML